MLNPHTQQDELCLKITPSKLGDHDAARKGHHPIDTKNWYCPWCNVAYMGKVGAADRCHTLG